MIAVGLTFTKVFSHNDQQTCASDKIFVPCKCLAKELYIEEMANSAQSQMLFCAIVG